MLIRTTAIWLGLMVVAIANGAFRGAVLVPRLGELSGRIWVFVPITTLLAPWLAARIRGQ